ncbi:glycosyltransferase family 9 protein [Thiomicrorhabdus sediminis]|uniref:Glycosyltransferase family 9 protein n=1 Tax=Thiomicrorhabdus sediminis TaxID=2580412 RepID=A0A4P9K895_9GAMM|nr:glycosyltransferase family 9 protein [Thiomicrorhabdus sediminis]QCU90700.1 glycosyltransferase family 9 protein [Thiomicrorhabdus sediminis]
MNFSVTHIGKEFFEPRHRLSVVKAVPLDNIQTILVIGIDQLGGLMMSTPFFRELRKAFPNAKIINLVGPLTYGVMQNCPYIDEAWKFDKKQSWALIKQLKRQSFDLAFLPSGTLRTSLMAYLAKIPHRVAYDDDGNGFLLTVRLHQELHSRYRVENLFDMLRAVGVTPSGVYEREIWLSQSDLDYADGWLSQKGWSEKTILSFNPFSTDIKRRWTDEGWQSLLHIVQKDNIQPVMLVAPNEVDVGEDLLKKWGIVDVPVESHAVTKTAAIVQKTHYVIGPESGFVHLGLAVNKPHVIAFYNVLPPVSTFPVDNSFHTAMIKTSVACAPCYLYKFKDVCPNGVECMKQLTADEVYQVIANYESQSV